MALSKRESDRLAFLKKSRPNDPEIKRLQAKAGGTGGGTKTKPVKQSQELRDFLESYLGVANAGIVPEGTTIENTVPNDTQNLITQLGAMTTAGNPGYVGARTPEMTNILNVMNQGLQGLSATENQALREQANEERNRAFQTQQRQQLIAQSRNNVRGPAAMAQQRNAARDFQQLSDVNERDILTKNIDIQDRRRGALQGALQGTENAEAGRLSNAQQTLGSIMAQRNSLAQEGLKFNAGQKDKQTAGLLSSAGNLAAIQSSNRASKAALKAAQRTGGGGGDNYANTTQTLEEILAQMGG